jgi:HSP20 family protein
MRIFDCKDPERRKTKMPEVTVNKKAPGAGAVSRAAEAFRPMIPLGRFFGVSPFAMMRELSDEMDRMFRGAGLEKEIEAWAPAVDVQQCSGNMVVSAELPGLKKGEVKVEVSDDALVIEGERKREHQEDHEGYHRWERSYGHFYRAVPLPEGAKTDQVKAELKEGVLKVSIPVPEAAKKSRQVSITG